MTAGMQDISGSFSVPVVSNCLRLSFMQPDYFVYYEGGTKVMPPIFSQKLTMIMMKFIYILGKFFKKMRRFSYKASFSISTLFHLCVRR